MKRTWKWKKIQEKWMDSVQVYLPWHPRAITWKQYNGQRTRHLVIIHVCSRMECGANNHWTKYKCYVSWNNFMRMELRHVKISIFTRVFWCGFNATGQCLITTYLSLFEEGCQLQRNHKYRHFVDKIFSVRLPPTQAANEHTFFEPKWHLLAIFAIDKIVWT